MFPFVLFIYFPSTFWSVPPPGDGERRRVKDEIRVAGLPHTAVGEIPISFDASDESHLLQHMHSIPCSVDGAPTVRRDGFHGRPADLLLPCAAHQKAVDCELDRCQVIAEDRVAEFKKPFS